MVEEGREDRLVNLLSRVFQNVLSQMGQDAGSNVAYSTPYAILFDQASRIADQLQEPHNINKAARGFFGFDWNDKAVEILERAIEKNPEDASLHHHLGFYLGVLSERHWEKARTHLERACELDPDNKTYREDFTDFVEQVDKAKRQEQERAERRAERQVGPSPEI